MNGTFSWLISIMSQISQPNQYALHSVQSTDIDFIHQALSDHRLTKYYAVHFDTMDETKEQMEWYAELESTGTGQWWIIKDTKLNAFVGAGGFNDFDLNTKSAEIGFWVLPEYWGRGIMRSCFPLVIEAGIEHLGIIRIDGYVESSNIACKAALEKTAFSLVKTYEEYDARKNMNLIVDHYVLYTDDSN